MGIACLRAFYSYFTIKGGVLLDHNLLIGGAAGQGMDTLSGLLERYLMRQGYYVFVNKDYMSRVRGGHNFIQIRFSDHPLTSHRHFLDLIVAMDETTIETHLSRLDSEGFVLCDKKLEKDAGQILSFPLESTAKEAGNPKTFTSVFLGLLIKWYGLGLEAMEGMIMEAFQDRSPETNLKAYQMGSKLTETRMDLPTGNTKNQLLINGNQAIALGAIAAGVTFYSAYPMTPSTSIMNYLASKQSEAGIVVEQAEDEIAAINMAIGANFAGIRAMTGTSGGGFSLMTELWDCPALPKPLWLLPMFSGPVLQLVFRPGQSKVTLVLC